MAGPPGRFGLVAVSPKPTVTARAPPGDYLRGRCRAAPGRGSRPYPAGKRPAATPSLGSSHERHGPAPIGRRAAARLAPQPAPQPARPGERGGGLAPPPELRRDRALQAQPRAPAAPGRTPDRAAARAEPPAAGRRLRPGPHRDPAGGRAHGTRARGARQDPHRPRALPGGDRRPALGPGASERSG